MDLGRDAVDRLERALKRSKRISSVRLPQGFARQLMVGAGAPPLVRTMRGGRGGATELKVYLTVRMIATEAPHDTKVAATELARMLDFPQPDGAGARRVTAALRRLEASKLIERELRPGLTPKVFVLEPTGTGARWDDSKLKNPYITLPVGLWRKGWFIALSGRALALLIILRELTGGRSKGGWADGVRKAQYGFSEDTWTRATKELVDRGLLEVEVHTYSSSGEPRRRNLYRLRLDNLEAYAPFEVPGDPEKASH
jgi:hypothetical protein